MFGATYSIFVVLLFEPPLPPLMDNTPFRTTHKITLLLTTWLAFCLPTDIHPAMSRENPGAYVFKFGRRFFYTYIPIVGERRGRLAAARAAAAVAAAAAAETGGRGLHPPLPHPRPQGRCGWLCT